MSEVTIDDRGDQSETTKPGEDEWAWLKMGDLIIRSDQIAAIRETPYEMFEALGIDDDEEEPHVLVHASFGIILARGIDLETAWSLL